VKRNWILLFCSVPSISGGTNNCISWCTYYDYEDSALFLGLSHVSVFLHNFPVDILLIFIWSVHLYMYIFYCINISIWNFWISFSSFILVLLTGSFFPYWFRHEGNWAKIWKIRRDRPWTGMHLYPYLKLSLKFRWWCVLHIDIFVLSLQCWQACVLLCGLPKWKSENLMWFWSVNFFLRFENSKFHASAIKASWIGVFFFSLCLHWGFSFH
jgi:hypothetical protein